jgi:hypothetical protein
MLRLIFDIATDDLLIDEFHSGETCERLKTSENHFVKILTDINERIQVADFMLNFHFSVKEIFDITFRFVEYLIKFYLFIGSVEAIEYVLNR